ncbi:WbqC family protein [Mesonia mobilis]|uniref:WbqC family protein n=1 Tax=Mesonia mobilis TaxID=369791 RepID=UPI0026F0C040|nr:WbqC family protein [Mesonia mobilis]
MKLAVMQPYFFPYLGYFQLIHSVEHFMFFDDVQYLRKSWMSRNRLLSIEKKAPFYIRPELIKPPYQTLLPEVKLSTDERWKLKLLEQTNTYKNIAPFYDEVRMLLEKILTPKYTFLSEFNIQSTIAICDALTLTKKFDKYSDYEFWFNEKPGPAEWGYFIAKELSASQYINAPGGEEFITSKPFQKAGIELGFIQPNLSFYDQSIENFIPGLSILDVLFFNGIKNTERLVKQYHLKWKRDGL